MLITAPEQDAKLRYIFDILNMKVYCVVLIRIAASDEYTKNTIFNI